VGEQIRFRTDNYRLAKSAPPASSSGRNPFKIDRRTLLAGVAGLAVGGALGYIAGMGARAPAQVVTGFDDILRARGLTPDEARAALQTFVPPGRPELDEFIMISSGGHSGQILVIGIPSMRLLKVVSVNTPEPWQGWGYGETGSMEIFRRLKEAVPPKIFFGGDTHHPDFDRRDAKYIGEWAFIGDKLGGQAAAISLKDFKTKDVIKIPNVQTIHGGAFTTPNTEYVVYVSQYPAPRDPQRGGYKPGKTYVKLTAENYKRYFRGAMTFLYFDRENMRWDLTKSFQIELPPYVQDLASVGWGPSDGIAFCNSFGTELVTTDVLDGKVPFEVWWGRNEYDYLHVVLWRKAEELVRQGKAEEINGIKVIRLETAIKEGILYFVPEPKSPHGNDITPSGRYNVIGGKLSPMVTVIDVEKLKRAIADRKFAGTDDYGVPIIRLEDVMAAQIEAGLGPLHNEFDERGHGYVSLFIDNKVVKYNLGPPDYTGDKPWTVVDKVDIHYNVGHIATPESNSPDPVGKWLVALNKWAVDRFRLVGPLLPQNFQLIDITGEKMRVVYDMPIPLGEPHYAKIIRAEKIKALDVYPPGTDMWTFKRHPHAIELGQERVERKQEGGRWVTEVWMTVIRSTIRPWVIRAKQGDIIRLHITNVEKVRDATHDFGVPEYGIQVSINPGETVDVEFEATHPGVYTYYCLEFCSPLHLEMLGFLEIEPAE